MPSPFAVEEISGSDEERVYFPDEEREMLYKGSAPFRTDIFGTAEYFGDITGIYNRIVQIYQSLCNALYPGVIEIRYNEQYRYPEYFSVTSRDGVREIVLELDGFQIGEPLQKNNFDFDTFNIERRHGKRRVLPITPLCGK